MNENLKIQSILDISKLVTSSKNFFNIKDEIVQRMLRVIHPTKSCVNLFLKNNYKYAYLVCSATLDYIPTLFDIDDYSGAKIDFDIYPRYIHESVAEKKIVWVKNIFDDERAKEEVDLAKNEGYEGRIVFPLIANDNVVGFLTCYLQEGDDLSQSDIDFISSVCSLIGLSIEITKKNNDIDVLIKKLRSVVNCISKATKLLYQNKDLSMFLKLVTKQLCKVTLSESAIIVLDNSQYKIKLFNQYGEDVNLNKKMEEILNEKNEIGALYNKEQLKDEKIMYEKINSYIYYKLRKNNKFIGYIAAANSKKYSSDDLKILSVFSSQVCLAIEMYLNSKREVEHRVLEKELEVVSHQQKLIMDEKIINLCDEREIAFFYSPSKYIGGDFCKMTQITDDIMCIFICDVMGHGILSNYFVAMIKGVLQTLIYENKKPNEIMTMLNKILYNDFDKVGIFATAKISFIDLKTGDVVSCNAGHHFPIGLTKFDNDLVNLDFERGMPVGVLEDVVYKNHTYNINNYKIVTMFTDGIIECRNKSGEEYGIERFKLFIKENSTLGIEELYEKLKETLYNFAESENLEDDLLVVFYKNKGDDNIGYFNNKC